MMWKIMLSYWTGFEMENLLSMRADEEINRLITETKDGLIYGKKKEKKTSLLRKQAIHRTDDKSHYKILTVFRCR